MEREIEKQDSFYITECSLSAASSLSYSKEGFLENYTGFSHDVLYLDEIVGGYLERETDEFGESLFEVLLDVSRESPVLYITVLKKNADVLEMNLSVESLKTLPELLKQYNGVIVAFDETRDRSLAKAYDVALQYC